MFWTWLVYPIIATALYYLGARAAITHWLWSRYPDWLYAWAVCPACSGAWYVAGLALLGRYAGWAFLGLPPRDFLALPIAACWGMVLVPPLAWLQLSALAKLEGQSGGESEKT